MLKQIPRLSVALILLGVAALLGIYSALRPEPLANSGLPAAASIEEVHPHDPTTQDSSARKKPFVSDPSARIGGHSTIPPREKETPAPLLHSTSTVTQQDPFLQLPGEGVLNQTASQAPANRDRSRPLITAAPNFPKEEPEPTKILAVIEGDATSFVLSSEQLGFSPAADLKKNEMLLRNQLSDEQTKNNALAQLTGAYSDKFQEITILQELARDPKQPESLRIGAFLKLADFGASYISSFEQTYDKAIQRELDLVKLLKNHQRQEGLPDGTLRAQVKE